MNAAQSFLGRRKLVALWVLTVITDITAKAWKSESMGSMRMSLWSEFFRV